MAAKTVVMVLDSDDPSRGEINIVASGEDAARLAEDLLESGIDVERIRVFDAVELSMRVAHRPVVSLGGATGEEFSAAPPEPLVEVDQEPPFSSGHTDGEEEPAAELVNAEPLVRNGVRFSSLFKSDDV
jgi:hypothetical protein